MRPIELVHVTTVPQSLSFLTGQIGYMKSRGVRVHVISSPGPGLVEYGERERVAVNAVEMPRRITPLNDLYALSRLTGTLRRIHPAIVHSHTPKAGLLGTVAAWIAHVPVRVYHIHGLPYLTARGARRKLLWWSERVACSFATRVFCVSHSIREVVVSEGLCPAAKVHVLHSGSIDGVDAQGRFHPREESEEVRAARRAELGIPPGALVIGYVGRIVRDKGVSELVEAWEQLAREFPQLHMLVVGDFEPQDPVPAPVEETLRSNARIHLAGFSIDTPSYYAAMDLVVLPSYREGMGLVLLEANAMGLPVVATRIPGIVDAVVDGQTGTLVSPRDATALAGAVRNYIQDPDLRRKHGALGRERVVRDFRPQRLWEATYQEYVQLLSDKGFKIEPVSESRPCDEAVETNRMAGLAGDEPVRQAGAGTGRAAVARAVKRIIDVSAASILLLVLAPVMAAVALLIRMDMGRPVIFRQVRPGRRAKLFTLYKFRTMTESCSADGIPRPDAERLTDLGRFLRRTSLDELPQLWNVLRGDVSLVGPRPLLVEYLPLYSPEQARRHEVTPGITGWAQVNGRNAIEWSRKLELDVWYVDHWNLWLDMRIIAVTVLKVLRREGITGKGEATAAPFTGEDEGKPCNRSGYSVQAVTPRS